VLGISGKVTENILLVMCACYSAAVTGYSYRRSSSSDKSSKHRGYLPCF